MSDLNRAMRPDLSPLEFKELLDLKEIEIYQALDLNEQASERYLDFLASQPEIQYLPSEGLNSETLSRANAQDHLAQFVMAIECDEQGDQEGAAQWFRKSAENGNIISAYNYAMTLTEPGERLPWLYIAAFKGVSEAQREVGLIFYQKGDMAIAQIWLGLAMRRGNAHAINDLGIIKWEESDWSAAVDYWQQAAEMGNENAISNIEMATTASIFDDEFDIGGNLDYSPTLPSSYQPPPVTVVESSKRRGFEIL